MSMNVGSSSADADPEVVVEMNTTPLIDVMLVLLIMLIVTIPIQTHSVILDLPAGNPPPPPVPPQVVTIDVDFDGTILWNGTAITTEQDLQDHLRAAAAEPDQPEVHLRPNKDAQYQAVASVLSAAQRVGITKLGVTGSEQFL